MSATLTLPRFHPPHIHLPYRKIALTAGIVALLGAGVASLNRTRVPDASVITQVQDYARYYWIGYYKTNHPIH